MLDDTSFPTDDDWHALVANLQFPTIRDRLIAEIPGVDAPMHLLRQNFTKGTDLSVHTPEHLQAVGHIEVTGLLAGLGHGG